MGGLFFLSSGLFLGWSLGANDAANIFGTAVSTRMVKFRTAAIVCSLFIALGAVVSGVGAAYTLGDLGSVNAIGGSFITAFAAAFTVYSMIKIGLPVSVSQAVVGAIIGWNFFTESVTDINSVVKIAGTWVACPLLAALFSSVLYLTANKISTSAGLHLLRRDALLRSAMILTGAFGAYSLGANNMANVVGVFVPVAPFRDIAVGRISVSAIQQLFFVGSCAAAVGVFTYSYRVMKTVGKGLMPLSPLTAWVVVLAQSLVLFIFASEGLEYFLASHDLPTVPLVPVSSTQAVVGAVIGVGLAKRAAESIKWSVVTRIVCGWIITPVIAAVICFFALFFMQNVFGQRVFFPKTYVVSDAVFDRMVDDGYPADRIDPLRGKTYVSGIDFINAAADSLGRLSSAQQQQLLNLAEQVNIYIDPEKIDMLDTAYLTQKQLDDIKALSGKTFRYRWELQNALSALDPEWAFLPETTLNKQSNKNIAQDLHIVEMTFLVRKTEKRRRVLME